MGATASANVLETRVSDKGGVSTMAVTTASRRAMLTRTAGLLGIGALAAACGQQAGPGGDKIKQGTSTREVTLLWSTWGNDQNISNTDAVPKGLAIFSQRFPKIKLTVLPESTNSWQERNEAMWLAGTGPDLSEHCCQWGPVWARQGLFLNLDGNIKKDFPAKIKDD